MSRIKEGIYILIIIVAGMAAVYNWNRPDMGPDDMFVPAWEPAAVVKVERVELPCQKVVVIKKAKIVKVLEYLPPDMAADEGSQITAVADIPAYAGTTRVAAVLDTRSGVTHITAKRQDLPLFAFLNEKEIGFRYGLNGSSGMGFDIYGQWTFIRVASVVGSLYAEGNSASSFKFMVSAGYRF